ncbi:SpoIID/LytB domain-containing protein [Sphaerothrix gracilis]|uniref:SpoIID/LytB domain-containing protein n=1 Tax=Sphaerothrix gracilis TaxID=3151835 RepID=UPI0031FDD708
MADQRLSKFLTFQFKSLLQKSSPWWGAFFVWLLVVLPARAQLELRVAIRNGADQVTLGSSTNAVIRDASGQALWQLPGQQAMQADYANGQVTFGDWQGDMFWVEPDEGGYVYIGDRWYRGRVLVMPSSSGLLAINYVDIEAYLYSVLGGEMPTNWPLQALQAQAVAARSYALYKRQNASNTLYDVGGTTTWQVYRGVVDETATTHAAVDATTGQVLTYGGQIIEAVFHSSSGGYTENVEDVWTQPLPYLRGVKDFDEGAPVYQWVESFSADQFRQRIPGVGNLIAAVPERTTPRGRVVTMRLQGNLGTRVLSGDELRRALGLRSTLFSLNIVEGGGVEVYGRGFGHGIGLSQWGAYNLAAQGADYRQILAHYYRDTALARIQVQ